MTIFSCSNCGTSLRKNQVEKHGCCGGSGGSQHITCMNCSKEFQGNEYAKHTKCISGNKKYGGSGYVAKENIVKKQEEWISLIKKKVISTSDMDQNLKNLLSTLASGTFTNIPRKKWRFLNFVSDSTPFADRELAKQAWEIFNCVRKIMKSTRRRRELNGTSDSHGGKTEREKKKGDAHGIKVEQEENPGTVKDEGKQTNKKKKQKVVEKAQASQPTKRKLTGDDGMTTKKRKRNKKKVVSKTHTNGASDSQGKITEKGKKGDDAHGIKVEEEENPETVKDEGEKPEMRKKQKVIEKAQVSQPTKRKLEGGDDGMPKKKGKENKKKVVNKTHTNGTSDSQGEKTEREKKKDDAHGIKVEQEENPGTVKDEGKQTNKKKKQKVVEKAQASQPTKRKLEGGDDGMPKKKGKKNKKKVVNKTHTNGTSDSQGEITEKGKKGDDAHGIKVEEENPETVKDEGEKPEMRKKQKVIEKAQVSQPSKRKLEGGDDGMPEKKGKKKNEKVVSETHTNGNQEHGSPLSLEEAFTKVLKDHDNGVKLKTLKKQMLANMSKERTIEAQREVSSFILYKLEHNDGTFEKCERIFKYKA